jgi:hypothetical protein
MNDILFGFFMRCPALAKPAELDKLKPLCGIFFILCGRIPSILAYRA